MEKVKLSKVRIYFCDNVKLQDSNTLEEFIYSVIKNSDDKDYLSLLDLIDTEYTDWHIVLNELMQQFLTIDYNLALNVNRMDILTDSFVKKTRFDSIFRKICSDYDISFVVKSKNYYREEIHLRLIPCIDGDEYTVIKGLISGEFYK